MPPTSKTVPLRGGMTPCLASQPGDLTRICSVLVEG